MEDLAERCPCHPLLVGCVRVRGSDPRRG